MESSTLESCSSQELADGIGQLHGVLAAAHRQLLALVAEYQRRELWGEDGAASMRDWLCCALKLSVRTAREWVEVAWALQSLPAIASAYESGRLSFDQVRCRVRVASPETDAELAEEAQGLNAAQIEAAARRARRVKDTAEENTERRYVRFGQEPESGWLRLWGRLAPDEGAQVQKGLERLAEQATAGPNGTYEPYESRCADALAELAATTIAHDQDPDRATVVLHVDEPALSRGEGVGELEGGAVVGAETARRLSCDARLQVVAHGRDGEVVSSGRTSRSVPAWLRRQLSRRDGACRFPGCARRRLVHAHHIVHWARGGDRDLGNLVLLCRYHHRLVHEGGWSVRGHPAGRLDFVRPDGRPLSTGPPSLRPELRRRLFEPSSCPVPT